MDSRETASWRATAVTAAVTGGLFLLVVPRKPHAPCVVGARSPSACCPYFRTQTAAASNLGRFRPRSKAGTWNLTHDFTTSSSTTFLLPPNGTTHCSNRPGALPSTWPSIRPESAISPQPHSYSHTFRDPQEPRTGENTSTVRHRTALSLLDGIVGARRKSLERNPDCL